MTPGNNIKVLTREGRMQLLMQWEMGSCKLVRSEIFGIFGTVALVLQHVDMQSMVQYVMAILSVGPSHASVVSK